MEGYTAKLARFDAPTERITDAIPALFQSGYLTLKEYDGRMDLALKMPDAIYILELKYGKTAEEATDQIIAKNYAVRFADDERPVRAVGLNISEDRSAIDRYKIVQVK